MDKKKSGRVKLIKGAFPNFVRLGNSELRWMGGNKYYKDGGMWSIFAEWIDGKLMSKKCNMRNLSEKELVEITGAEWAKGNDGYTKTNKLMNKDIIYGEQKEDR